MTCMDSLLKKKYELLATVRNVVSLTGNDGDETHNNGKVL